MAWGDERDFGMAGGRDPGPNGGGHPGIGMEDTDADVVSAIAAQLESASDAGVDPSTNWAGGFNPELDQHWGVLGPSPVPDAVAVNQQGDRLGDAQVQALINLQSQSSIPDTWSNPYVSQNYSDFGTAGIDTAGQGNVSRGLNYADAMAIETRRQELSAELDRLNTISVQASNATDPYPSSWTSPDEWGMQDVRAAGMGPSPTDAQARLGDPVTPLGADVTRSVFPSALETSAFYPSDYQEAGMPSARTGWSEDVLGQQTWDPTVRRDWQIQHPSPLETSVAGPTRQHFPTPLESSRPGPTQGQLNTWYPSPLESSVPFVPDYQDAGMPDTRLEPLPRSPLESSIPFVPDYQDAGMPDVGLLPESIDRLSGGELDRSTNQTAEAMLEEQAWRTVNDPDVDDYIEGKITAEELSKINSVADLEKVVKKDVMEKSKRLTPEEKKANVAARRAKEQEYVAFRDTLNFEVEMLRSRLATAINTHGKNSKEAKKVKRDVRNKEADLRLWERSDIYIKSYGMVNKSLLTRLGPMKLLNSVEDYFHSLGKTERRSPEVLLQDMKDKPEKYERVGNEVSAAQLVRNMYPFLRNVPMDVAAAAAREPAYLRYLINLNVNKQPIPTSYSSNWKNDISDAWIYG